jgi:predicted transcriptional regulator
VKKSPAAGTPHLELGTRERQIMEAVYRLGEATVGDVRSELDDPPTYSTIRAMMGKLEAKGRLKHRSDGPRYVYSASVPKEDAQRSTLRRVVDSLFDGSTERTMAAILDLDDGGLDAGELERLQRRMADLRKDRD